MSTAEDRLKAVMPHLRLALGMARFEGTPAIGILTLNSDGSGKVVAQFNVEFLFDLAEVLELKDPDWISEQAVEMAAKASQRDHLRDEDLDKTATTVGRLLDLEEDDKELIEEDRSERPS